jgi:SAM-dependent methyltransferase
MVTSVPERVRWAVDVLDIQPNERLLEVGPGPGVAAALIGDRLVDGSLVAIDRSEVAVRRTVERNRTHLAAGKVVVRHGSLEDFEGGGGPFNKVFAINVNFFWTRDAAAELELIARILVPRGSVYLFFEAPTETKAREIAGLLRDKLRLAEFEASIKKAGAMVAIVGSRAA